MQKLLYIIVSIVVLCFVFRIAIGFFSANRVATGLTISDGNPPSLSGCDNLMNCTSSTATNKKNHTDAISYSGASEGLMDKIAAVITTQAGTNIETLQPNYLHATYKTKLLGYTDDLELLLDEATGVLHVRSASRIGQSDLGANRKRIDALRILLQGKI